MPMNDSSTSIQTNLKGLIEKINNYLQNNRNLKVIKNSNLFDFKYYQNKNPDVVNSNIDLLTHYIQYGYLEGRNPNLIFNSSYYLSNINNNTRVNPLVDYIESNESKKPHPLFDVEYFKILAKISDNNDTVLSNYLRLFSKSQINLKSETNNLYKEIKQINFDVTSSLANIEVSIIIPCFNNLFYTLLCLYFLLIHKSIYKFEIIVIDDNSTDDTNKYLANLNSIRYLKNDINEGFITSCNKAANQASGKYLMFLNNDTLIFPNWLDSLITTLENNESCGLVGSHLLNFDLNTQEAGGLIYQNGEAGNFGRNLPYNHPKLSYFKEVPYCSGASIAIPKALWHDVNGFDELYKPAYYEDTDLAFKIRQAGYKVYYQPDSKLIHFEGLTSGRDTSTGTKAYQLTNQEKFYQKWCKELLNYPQKSEKKSSINYFSQGKSLLYVEHNHIHPDRDAGSQLNFTMLKIFKELNYDVTFVSVNELNYDDSIKALQDNGIECLYAPFYNSILEIIEKNEYDYVVLSRSTIALKYLWSIRQLLPLAKIIFMVHDLAYLRELREAENTSKKIDTISHEFFKAQELHCINSADLSLVLSSKEQAMLADLCPKANIGRINFIMELHSIIPKFEYRKDILFIGGFLHSPNVDAVLYFIKSIFPIIRKQNPDLKFYIIGQNPPPEIEKLANDNIILLNQLPNIDHHLESARLTIAPLRYGAGAKGKVATSISYGVPAIVTSIASEGMGLTHKSEVLIANTEIEFANAVLKLYNDEQLWNKMSKACIEFAKLNYSVASTKINIQKLISNLTK